MSFTRNIDPWEQLICVAAGAVVGAYGWRKGRTSAVIAGATLAARGVVGYCPVKALNHRRHQFQDTRVALSGNRGIKLEESVTIRRTANELYALWRPLAQLPSLIPHIERVDVLDDRRSHWVMRGPVGMHFEWDAEIINDVRPDIIAWRSLPGADVVTAGSVRFRERERRAGLTTELTVSLQYQPIGGKAAAVLAWLSGQSPASMLREDLRRLKARLEAGDVPIARTRPHGRRSVLATVAGVDA